MPDLEILADGLEFPEGPVVMPDGSVILCEIAGRRITRVSPDGAKSLLAEVPGGPNGLALGPDGQIFICNNGGGFEFARVDGVLRPVGMSANWDGGRIEVLNPETGHLRELYRRVGDYDLLMPNDLMFDQHGGFYFTDHGRRQDRGLSYGGVYYGKADGSGVAELVHNLNTPNGIGLSPDGARVYMASTEMGRIYRFDVLEPGKVTQPTPPTMIDFVHAQVEGFRRYDSLAMEANGNICVASLNPGNITVISPEGKEVETIPMPDPMPTNIAFGGADMRTAFINLSGKGQLAVMRWPRPGLKLPY
jgi:gluconolactonase